MTSPQCTLSTRRQSCLGIVVLFLQIVLIATLVSAKESPATAIVLFDGPAGPAYVQIAGFSLNGKTELRVCDGVPRINKSVYDTLSKVQLTGAASLERTNDGTLMLNVNAKTLCVVPGNLKFDRNAEFTPAEAADQAVLQGSVISSSMPSSPAISSSNVSSSSTAPSNASSLTQGSDLPPLKRGVRVVFVAAPDDELAQFLLAQRSNSIAGWQDFISRHGSSVRAADAKNALAAIYEESAEAAFSRYEKSTSGEPADIAALKDAEQQATKANTVVAGYPAAAKLQVRISHELDSLLQADSARLQSYRKALAEHTAGYTQLAAARRHMDNLLGVNPEYAPVINLHFEIVAEVRKLESSVQQAEGLAAVKDYDQALQALEPYRAFAEEMPRIGSIVTAAYGLHFQRGREMAARHEWETAVMEFRHAVEIDKKSQEARTELKDAESQWAVARDREAVRQALERSRVYADSKDFIAAYETLAELRDSERPLVADQLASLQKEFVPAALRRSQKLQEIHMPIRGRADEDAIQEAYELLTDVNSIAGDPAIKLKLDLLSDRMSAYYVDRAQHYLSKPLGSGVGIGWLYLSEAERYKPNQDAVRDTKAQYAPAYQLRSRLSIGVVLRDQTSRRDSVGFADQLADAIANGLESDSLVKVVRQPKESTNAIQPNFLLVGEILAHRVVKDANLETPQSKYRAGTHDVKNEEWSKANDNYSSAQQALQAAQRSLADAHSKKDIAAANDAVATAQKNLDEARHTLDAIDPTRPQAIIEPYNYTKKTTDLTATIELAFHLTDTEGNVIESGLPIKQESHKHFVVLENVKPEDTEGVKNQGTEPDEVQFLNDLEIQARDILVKSVREKAMVLPAKVLEAARNKAQQNDVDGAAGEYIVYLNTNGDSASLDRAEAAKFLREHYNLTVGGTSTDTGRVQAEIVR